MLFWEIKPAQFIHYLGWVVVFQLLSHVWLCHPTDCSTPAFSALLCLLEFAQIHVLVVKNPPANAGEVRDAGSIPGSGRSPAGGHSHPLHYSCLENPMDRGARRTTVHRVSELDMTEQLSMQAHTCPLSPWCYLSTSSSATPLLYCLQSFPV